MCEGFSFVGFDYDIGRQVTQKWFSVRWCFVLCAPFRMSCAREYDVDRFAFVFGLK